MIRTEDDAIGYVQDVVDLYLEELLEPDAPINRNKKILGLLEDQLDYIDFCNEIQKRLNLGGSGRRVTISGDFRRLHRNDSVDDFCVHLGKVLFTSPKRREA